MAEQNQNPTLETQNYQQTVRQTIVRAHKGPAIVKVPTILSRNLAEYRSQQWPRKTMPYSEWG